MTLEAGKEMDRKCVLNWLNEVYIAPSLSYSEYTDEEIRMFAHDALVLLNEQESLAKAANQEHQVNEYLQKQLAERPEIVRCEECKWNRSTEHNPICEKYYEAGSVGWFCADGKRR